MAFTFERHWRVIHSPNPDPNNEVPWDQPQYTDWFDRPYLQPGAMAIRTMGHSGQQCQAPGEIWDPAAFEETLTTLTFMSYDGTEYELRDEATGGRVAANASCHNLDNYRFRGTVFRSSNGSGLTFIADSAIEDNAWGMTSFPGGFLRFTDGTCYRIRTDGRIDWMRDRNGNKISFAYSSNVVTSWSYKAADGTRIEVHAYQHIPTGKVVEFKSKSIPW